jgi:hypothetical protein
MDLINKAIEQATVSATRFLPVIGPVLAGGLSFLFLGKSIQKIALPPSPPPPTVASNPTTVSAAAKAAPQALKPEAPPATAQKPQSSTSPSSKPSPQSSSLTADGSITKTAKKNGKLLASNYKKGNSTRADEGNLKVSTPDIGEISLGDPYQADHRNPKDEEKQRLDLEIRKRLADQAIGAA